MEDEILNDIKDYAVRRLMDAYGFCGVAVMNGEVTILNSTTNDGKELKITLKEAYSGKTST